MKQALFASCALALAACTSSLPAPCAPLVPTPDASFRSAPPEPARKPEALVLPPMTQSRLESGLTVSEVTIQDAPYSDVNLVIRLRVPEAEADALSLVLNEMARADLHFLGTTMRRGSLPALRLRWRCEPGELEAAVKAAAAVAIQSPSEKASRSADQLHALRAQINNDSFAEIMRDRLLGADSAGRTAVSAHGARELAAELRDPTQMALIVSGPSDASSVRALIERYFARMPRTAAPKIHAHALRASRPAYLFVPEPQTAEIARIGFGFSAPDRNASERYAARILSEMLAGGVGSLLNRMLRSEAGSTYGVHMGAEDDDDTSVLYGSFAVPTNRVRPALAQLRSTFELLGTREQPEQFERAKRRVLARLRASARRADRMSDRLVDRFVRDETRGDLHELDTEDAALEALESVQPIDVQLLARDVLMHPLLGLAGPPSVLADLQWEEGSVEIVKGR